MVRPNPKAVIVEQIRWRKVIGAFQFAIPVHTKAELLLKEERLLSVMLWIAQSIPHTNRWHPVFVRYLKAIGSRVSVFGGDPGKILPSPTGEGVPGRPHPHHPGSGNKWQTHLVTSSNAFITRSDLILADVPDANGSYTATNPIGDYAGLIAVGKNFYGIFCGDNTPDNTNFPNGVTVPHRCHRWSGCRSNL
jgi:hypothetical protein